MDGEVQASTVEHKPKRSLETKNVADAASEAILATSCPLVFRAWIGVELGIGCDGEDKSQ